jgi:hypothetical protein
MLGSVYLIYSAYYISMTIPSLRFFISFILNIMYLVLAMITTQNTIDTLEDLREDLEIARAGDSQQFYEPLELKINQMRRYL